MTAGRHVKTSRPSAGARPLAGYGPQEQAGKVDRYLYNGFLTVTLVY